MLPVTQSSYLIPYYLLFWVVVCQCIFFYLRDTSAVVFLKRGFKCVCVCVCVCMRVYSNHAIQNI